MIADALRLYAEALDAPRNHSCFVALWQLAEVTTAMTKERGATTQDVAKRLTWHTKRWRLPGFGLRRTLHELGNTRNDIVHKGIQHITENEINTLKIICEMTIEWLIAARSDLPTRHHVRMVYRDRDEGDTVLVAQRDAAEFVRRLRQGRPGEPS